MRITNIAIAAATVLIACNLISCASPPELIAPEAIHSTADPQIIERGRYLVHGPAHCASCHGDPARTRDLLIGKEVPLSGGHGFDAGLLGTFVAPNITSDPLAGIGARSDEALVRSLRYGISHSGRPLAPFMPFAELADDDLRAIISFLRTLAPEPKPAPAHKLTWLGKFVVSFLLQPQTPDSPPTPHIQPERSAEYGRYLAHTVANCHGCHTRRSRLSGAFIGQPFAGGMTIEDANGTFITPNLTPTPGARLHALSEQEFTDHFRMRAQLPTHSPMPWPAFARMTDDDLGAIYRYLRTLPPSEIPGGKPPVTAYNE